MRPLRRPGRAEDEVHARTSASRRATPTPCPLRLKVRLISWEKDAVTKAKRLKHIKEQEVYFGDIPLMTEKGTFIFNGIERVVVSQLQRSPGVFFRQGEVKGYFIAKIIPYRGAWVEFEYDVKNNLYVRLDRKKKFLATVFLRALGFSSDEDILRLFHKVFTVTPENGKLSWDLADGLVGKTLAEDIEDPKGKTVLFHAKKKITPEVLARSSRTSAWPGWPSTARTSRAPTPWPASRARSRATRRSATRPSTCSSARASRSRSSSRSRTRPG